MRMKKKETGRKEKKQVAVPVPLVLNANWKQRVTSNKQQAKKIVDRLAQLDVHSTTPTVQGKTKYLYVFCTFQNHA